MRCDACGNSGAQRVECIERSGASIRTKLCAAHRLKARKRGVAVALLGPEPSPVSPVTPTVRAEYEAMRTEFERLQFERDEWKFAALSRAILSDAPLGEQMFDLEQIAESFIAWRHSGQDMETWLLARKAKAGG